MSATTSEFAKALQAARTARGASVLDVAHELRLSDKQIQGLENDDLANFYSLIYAERAATNYARHLGVSTDLLGGPPYGNSAAPPLAVSVSTVATPTAVRKLKVSPSVGLYGAVGVLLAGVIIYLTTGSSNDAPPSPHDNAVVATPTAAAPTEPAMQPTVQPAPVSSRAPQQLEVLPPPEAPRIVAQEAANETPPSDVSRARRFWLVVNRPALVNVTDAGGKKLLSGRLPISEGQRVVGDPPFQLETDDPESIDVFYVGNRVRPLQSSTNRYTARFGAPD